MTKNAQKKFLDKKAEYVPKKRNKLNEHHTQVSLNKKRQ